MMLLSHSPALWGCRAQPAPRLHCGAGIVPHPARGRCPAARPSRQSLAGKAVVALGLSFFLPFRAHWSLPGPCPELTPGPRLGGRSGSCTSQGCGAAAAPCSPATPLSL